jgi:hypothetical protein
MYINCKVTEPIYGVELVTKLVELYIIYMKSLKPWLNYMTPISPFIGSLVAKRLGLGTVALKIKGRFHC